MFIQCPESENSTADKHDRRRHEEEHKKCHKKRKMNLLTVKKEDWQTKRKRIDDSCSDDAEFAEQDGD